MSDRRDRLTTRLRTLRDRRASLSLEAWMALPPLLRIEMADHEGALEHLGHATDLEAAARRLDAYERCVARILDRPRVSRPPRRHDDLLATVGLTLGMLAVVCGYVGLYLVAP